MEHDPNDCAYCEEQRELEQKKRELEAIRAFVERVNARFNATGFRRYDNCVTDELEAMEAVGQSND